MSGVDSGKPATPKDEAAAVLIQKVARGRQSRQSVHNMASQQPVSGRNSARLASAAPEMTKTKSGSSGGAGSSMSAIQAAKARLASKKQGATKEEAAATKVQAVQRGKMARQSVKSLKEGQAAQKQISESAAAAAAPAPAVAGEVGAEEELKRTESATKIQAQLRGRQVRKDNEAQAQAATKMQANVRGHQVRRSLEKKGSKEDVGEEKKTLSEQEAATKMQAATRGHLERQKLKNSDQEDPGKQASKPSVEHISSVTSVAKLTEDKTKSQDTDAQQNDKIEPKIQSGAAISGRPAGGGVCSACSVM